MNEPQRVPSPIEEEVASALPKYLDSSVELVPEHPITYLNTTFRLDFLLRHRTGFYGLECDGKAYHCGMRDSFRDACILGASGITAIYRISGKDIWWNLETAIHLISTDVPDLFTSRGRTNLQTLSKFRDETSIHRTYDYISAFDQATHEGLVVTKLDRSEEDQYWRVLFNFAQRFPNLTMEQIADEYLKTVTFAANG